MYKVFNYYAKTHLLSKTDNFLVKSQRVRAVGQPNFKAEFDVNNDKEKSNDDESSRKMPRKNDCGIQMINENIRSLLFGKEKEKKQENIDKAKNHLKLFDLWDKPIDYMKDIDCLDLPKIEGKDLDEHFRNIAEKQIGKYVQIISTYISKELPDMPMQFNYEAGWTKYDSKGSGWKKVDFPDDKLLVFDVEVLVADGNIPTMAVAVSDTAWYSWCSERIFHDSFEVSKHVEIDDLIPLQSIGNKVVDDYERVVVCHNAGFDRSFVKEQYFTQKTKLNFLDTMSMHIACCGYTSEQRTLSNSVDDKDLNSIEPSVNAQWKGSGSLNNLHDVHKFYCEKSERINKDLRDTFVKGTMKDVRDRFQKLMRYCATDVRATFEILKQLYPRFTLRFPHPVTLSGMFEMGSMYLPVNKNWLRYIENCENSYKDMQHIVKNSLIKSANEACEYIHKESYKNDPWLFDLDWTQKEFKTKKPTTTKTKTKKLTENDSNKIELNNTSLEENAFYKTLDPNTKLKMQKPSTVLHPATQQVMKTSILLSKTGKNSSFYNYPKELCEKPNDTLWMPGASEITVKSRITPKLLRLTWQGFPLFYDSNNGWGYLVPRLTNYLPEGDDLKEAITNFPYEKLKEICNFDKVKCEVTDWYSKKQKELKNLIEDLQKDSENLKNQKILLKKIDKNKEKKMKKLELELGEACEYHHGIGPIKNVLINGCYFFRIPHKDGTNFKVGNPLAKAFLTKLTDGTLNSFHEENTKLLLKGDTSMHYWENNEKRIRTQALVWLSNLQELLYKSDSNIEGAILPRTIVSGTITRRAVEPTWLTASNYKSDRIGSELKAMIQAPDDYYFVGADVDSQELWIASLIGDSHFAQMHGCTAIGWMTLQGKKKDGTDMHSRTASLIGISRDHAKVMNYARIYGAGNKYAEKLLLQFNPNMTEFEASKKARDMYKGTKGIRSHKTRLWREGSESEMFNKLEDIAKSAAPKTPVLGASITKSLEPKNVNEDFMTSRINWVVQSSAVDYLHLMLVCMKWLLEKYNIQARFSISIHDEVRYLVKSEDRYRAALALHITNLFTRALFAYKLGFDDLPVQVAFFSEVDVDKCLRKDVKLEFVTPSNPLGLSKGFGIPEGETLDIYGTLEKTKGTLAKKINGSE